jgi:hypothetical protein
VTATPREIVRRLRAFGHGRPLPRGETITIPVAEEGSLASLVFVRMGGEARPWAVGFQRADARPFIRTVPDGRQADPIGEMLAELAEVVCGFLGSPLFRGEDDEFSGAEMSQVWLPNAAHLSMLHLLNLRYTFARADEGSARTQSLKALGRACGYMFREASRADEVGVVDAGRALRDAYTFPVDEVRGQHLGLLVAYLEEGHSPEELAVKAEAAEGLSVSTTLDPELERSELQPLVERFNSAVKGGKSHAIEESRARIDGILRAEVGRRLELTLQAAGIIRRDPRESNPGTEVFVAESVNARTWQYLNFESAIAQGDDDWPPPSAETDRGRSSAARRFIRMVAANDSRASTLLPHDEELIEEAIAAGDGIRGRVVKVERRVPEGKSRRAPFWEIETSLTLPLRLKVGSDMGTLNLDPGGGYIESIEQRDGVRIVTVCMNKRSSGAPAYSSYFMDREVVLLPTQSDFAGKKIGLLKREPGPGSWLARGDGARPAKSPPYEGDPLDEIAALRNE